MMKTGGGGSSSSSSSSNLGLEDLVTAPARCAEPEEGGGGVLAGAGVAEEGVPDDEITQFFRGLCRYGRRFDSEACRA